MEIGVYLKGNSKGHAIPLPDPRNADAKEISEKINTFAKEHGLDITKLDVIGLIPKMIRGVLGCEHGCPSTAKSLVRCGHHGFFLEYIDGGVLNAMTEERELSIKLFPSY